MLNLTDDNLGYCDRLVKAVITVDMTKYLFEKLTLIRNSIVDFKPNSLLSYTYFECFITIIFLGDRYSMTNGFKTN